MPTTGNKLATAIGGTTYTVTNTNAQTTYLYTNVLAANTGSNTFQVNITRTSGALGGSVTLQASLDGTNWFTPAETAVSLVDGATQVIAILTTKRFLYYRLAITSTGTVVMTTEAYQVEDKEPIS